MPGRRDGAALEPAGVELASHHLQVNGIAQFATHLCSGAADCFVEQVFPVCGGWVVRWNGVQIEETSRADPWPGADRTLETRPGHANFGRILDSDGTVLLCLHQWGAHEHPSLRRRDEATPGNGLLLFFRVDDFEMSLTRARALVARLEEEPHANPNTRTMEFALRDPDGYYVSISEFSLLELRGHA